MLEELLQKEQEHTKHLQEKVATQERQIKTLEESVSQPLQVWRDRVEAAQGKLEEAHRKAESAEKKLAMCALSSSSGEDGWRQHKVPEPPAVHTTRNSKWAYVTLVHDESGGDSSLLRVLPLARALQRLSNFPLILLTNKTDFEDGTEVVEGMRHLNVDVLPLHSMDDELGDRRSTAGDLLKLQAWRLTQYERLIWLDSDSIIYRSLDWLFERSGMWALRDDPNCQQKATMMSSALMLLEPSLNDYSGLVRFALASKESSMSGQAVIGNYFKEVHSRSVNLLNNIEASFGQCLGMAATPYLNLDGSEVQGYWSTPAFVYKSGGWGHEETDYLSVCFSHRVERQKYVVGASVINACQYNPLGIYWRGLFCDAAGDVGIGGLTSVAAFCSDSCYYLGQGGKCDGPVNATMTAPEYFSRTKGMPQPELKLPWV